MTQHDMKHLDFLEDVAKVDVQELLRKEATYQGSWKRRGGVGAFMMLARKWDRLEQMCERWGYDVFGLLMHEPNDGRDGTALAEIRDLRRYLLLVEAEYQKRLAKPRELGPISTDLSRNERLVPRFQHDDGTPKEDSNKHAQTEEQGRTLLFHLEGDAQYNGVTHPRLYTEPKPGSGHWRLKHVVDTRVLRDLSPADRACYLDLNNGISILRRDWLTDPQILELPRFDATYGKMEIEKLPKWTQAMYEPDAGAADGQYVLKKDVRVALCQ